MDINTVETPTVEIDFNPEDMVALRGTLYKPTHYTLLIRLNDNCNLDCSYCTMHSKENMSYTFNTPYQTIMEYIKITFDKILSLDRFLSIDYYFYGGEPTMYREFEKLINTIHNLHLNTKLDYLIETQTNLTKPITFFERLLGYNIKFICSYQNCAQNELFGIKHIELYLDKAKYLMENNMTHGFDIMLEDPNSSYYTNSVTKPKPEEIKYIYKELKNIFESTKMVVKFGIQMNTIDSVPTPDIYKNIYQDHKTISEKLFITLKDNTERVIAFNDIVSDPKYNNFRFWYCDVGVRQFMISFINKTPDVWWCMSDMFAKTQSLAQTPNEYKLLLDSTFQKSKSPRCIHKRCACELFIPKRRKQGEN